MLTRVHLGSKMVSTTRLVSLISVILIHAISLECSSSPEAVGIARRDQGFVNRTSRVTVVLCCPLEERVVKRQCEHVGINDTIRFPPLYRADGEFELLEKSPKVERFRFIVASPCNKGRFKLNPDKYPSDEYKLLDNGKLYRPPNKAFLNGAEYCLGRVAYDKLDVLICFLEEDDAINVNVNMAYPIGMILSTPFLFVTFLVYTVVPELNNMHGLTLRGYIGSLLVAYILLAILQTTPQKDISDFLCFAFAYIIYFSFLASFFWLNVMCFDIWWTFGGFRSLQGSVKQRERKKFLIYSIYAWGFATILTSICVLMDNLHSIPDHFIRPGFGIRNCWFLTHMARAIYFYCPMGITVLCNICLFISTSIKIVQHRRDTANHLRGVDSRRHDDKKQWFNLYLKLFIVMGINWSMEIISWMCNDKPRYIWYLSDLTNTLQGVIIFLIFVWKEKIRRLLLKRLRCHDRNILSRNSTRSAYHSSASRTCTTNSVGSTQVMASPAVPITPTSSATPTSASTLLQGRLNTVI
ncbi:G-protein coupled receptor Mth2 isoform X2 [Megalopta genalis]|uniref:G-protein coupled receptor Mth2 isoform X2 n=1 Tax=Megalopta genalis TaxID=115081 RepID=UPI003FD575D4